MESILPTEEGGGVNLDDFSNFKPNFDPDNLQGKVVITIHGSKNGGKSTIAFLITTGRMGGFRPGKVLAISFDDKTKTTYDQFFKNEDITIHDGTKYYTEDPLIKTKSGYMSYLYLQKLLEHEAPKKYDWIFFDGLTIESEILEMSMRYINGLRPTQGFTNRNLWKDRGSMLRTLHKLATNMVNIGVIYSTYSEKDEIIKDGETITKEDIPKYVDVIMVKTDVVLKATKAKGKSGNIFYLTVEGTKFKQYYDNGKLLPVTDRTLLEGRVFDVTGMSEQKKTTTILPDEKISIQEFAASQIIPEKVPAEVKSIEKSIAIAEKMEQKSEPRIEIKKMPLANIPDLL